MKKIVLYYEFKKFCEESKGLEFEEKLLLWERYIESPNQDLYNCIVWEAISTPNWDKYRIHNLKYSFKKYEDNHKDILDSFEKINEAIDRAFVFFENAFPGVDFSNLVVVIIPTVGCFNGKVENSCEDPNTIFLGLGADFITWTPEYDLETICIHEMAHILHFNLSKINKSVLLGDTDMTFPLFFEGLATWMSKYLYKEKILKDIFLGTQDDVDSMTKNNIALMSKEYIEISSIKVSENDFSNYIKWFDAGVIAIDSLPNRLGYYLGYYVVDGIIKNSDLKEIICWDIDRIRTEVIKQLKDLSRS